MKARLILLLFILLNFSTAHAASKITSFPSEKMEQDYRWLIRNLRCQECANQSLADSEAGLAGDLRNKVIDLLHKGKNRTQVVDYLTQRFGDKVSYVPGFKASTILLWTLPFVLLGIAVYVMNRAIRKNRLAADTQPDTLNQSEQQKLEALLARTQKTPQKNNSVSHSGQNRE